MHPVHREKKAPFLAMLSMRKGKEKKKEKDKRQTAFGDDSKEGR